MRKFGITVGGNYVQSIHCCSIGESFSEKITCAQRVLAGKVICCKSYGFAVKIADIVRAFIRIEGYTEKEYPIKIVELKK